MDNMLSCCEEKATPFVIRRLFFLVRTLHIPGDVLGVLEWVNRVITQTTYFNSFSIALYRVNAVLCTHSDY